MENFGNGQADHIYMSRGMLEYPKLPDPQAWVTIFIQAPNYRYQDKLLASEINLKLDHIN